jgi:hypothetical protein
MKYVIGLLLPVLTTGCGPSVAEANGSCATESFKTMSVNDQNRYHFVEACMLSKGFVLDVSQKGCGVDYVFGRIEPVCWRRK